MRSLTKVGKEQRQRIKEFVALCRNDSSTAAITYTTSPRSVRKIMRENALEDLK